MANESGEMKLLGNFSKLIELVSIDPAYNPANPKIEIPALNAQKAAAHTVVQAIGREEAPYKAAVNDRQEAFESLGPIVSRSGNMLQASGAGKLIIEDARAAARKIVGRRKTPKPTPDPDGPAPASNTSHSASQLSYENIVGNVDDYVAILATVPSYAPNETELTVAGLTVLSNTLKARNNAVNATFAPVSAARGLRDQLLYTNEDSVVNIALQVKAYVRAAFGSSSQLWKSISGLAFKRRG